MATGNPKVRSTEELVTAIGRALQAEYSRRIADPAGYIAEIDGEHPELPSEESDLLSQLRSDLRDLELEARSKARFEDLLAEAVSYLTVGDIAADAELERRSGADVRRAFELLSQHHRELQKLLDGIATTWQEVDDLAEDPEGARILAEIIASAHDEAGTADVVAPAPVKALEGYSEILRKCCAALRLQFRFHPPASGTRGEDRVVNVLVKMLADIGIPERLIAKLLPELGLTPGKVRSRLDYLQKRKAAE